MSRPGTARLFVAIDPPASVREQLAAWARLAFASQSSGASPRAPRSVRLLAPDTMHLTLCFLGSRPVAELELVVAAMQELTAPGAELSLGAPLWLPPRRPRTLAVAVHDRTGALARLRQAVVQALAGALDWQPERRRFRAHVTVARLGRERSRTRSGSAADLTLAASPQLRFVAREVVLYRSWLEPVGASYEALTTRSLAASSGSSSDGMGGSGEDPAGP
jgi:RNA 2',3'-cyclic 3'-phosphodiesterase